MIDPDDRRTLLTEAGAARRSGRSEEALGIAQRLVNENPHDGPAFNLLGLIELDRGNPVEAIRHLSRAVAIDPDSPPAWLNLARAQQRAGQLQEQLDSLDRALAQDAYFLPAILAKGEALFALKRQDEALELYRLLFQGLGDISAFPQPIQEQLGRARDLLDQRNDVRHQIGEDAVVAVGDLHPGEDLSRARIFAEQAAGRRKIYHPQPIGNHFPFLAPYEFFPRSLMPWLEKLDAHTDTIRAELLQLWSDDDPDFRPYVRYGKGEPVANWGELNHSPRWSAWFLWENGTRYDRNCSRCPRTAAALEELPMLDMPGKGPTAMFSVLAPRTRIPPHTGSTNTRCTVHLPLIVPSGCGFRVGGDVREWREGSSWAFDDTIEHEAWNDSDQVRAILIIDAWNPLLSEAEREVVRRIG